MLKVGFRLTKQNILLTALKRRVSSSKGKLSEAPTLVKHYFLNSSTCINNTLFFALIYLLYCKTFVRNINCFLLYYDINFNNKVF